MVLFTASRGNTFVGGTCDLPSALLVFSDSTTLFANLVVQNREKTPKSQGQDQGFNPQGQGLDHRGQGIGPMAKAFNYSDIAEISSTSDSMAG